MSSRKILVTHPWMDRGGSEATAMWTLQALQDRYSVTFVTASTMDWEDLNEIYGTSVDPGKITFIRAPRLPTVDGPLRLVQAQHRYFEKFCHSMAAAFDLCISAYNPIDFGRPGIQLVGDFSFSEEMRKLLYSEGDRNFCHKQTPIRKAYLWFSHVIGIPSRPLRERRDLVVANSGWSKRQLETNFGVPRAPVIYPPVILPRAESKGNRDPFGFVSLGRIVPEKRIDRMIRILEGVREGGVPVTLRLIGKLDDSDYARGIARQIEGKHWIKAEGYLTLRAKQEILATQSFGIHACKIEAFGIAVAEMASMGCLPFVPDTGGACEIVSSEDLQFSSEEDAVEKILTLFQEPGRVAELRDQLSALMHRFGPEVFMRELHEHVVKFAGFKDSPADAAPKKNLPAYR